MTKHSLRTIKITFENNPLWAINALCFQARQINSFFFQKNNFLVLPVKTPFKNTVYFPDLPYTKKFWRLIKGVVVKKSGKQLGVANLFTKDLLAEAQKIVSGENLLSKSNPKAITFLQDLLISLKRSAIFDKEIALLEKIIILPLTFGTTSSFSFREVGTKVILVMTIRDDYPISELGRSLIKSLLLVRDQKYRWHNFTERETIANFLIETYFPNLINEPLITNASHLKTISNRFLTKLGFKNKTKVAVTNEKLLVNGKNATKNLSYQEQTLLRLLIENNGKTVSYDQIAQTIWGNDFEQKFSLWAITKLKQKVNQKLEILGAKNAITTTRNEGYSLL